MQNAFLRWLLGTPPVIVGAWWDSACVCLVRIDRTAGSMHISHAFEQLPARKEPWQRVLSEALGLALDRIGRESATLALAIAASEVLTKSVEVPVGLDESALSQLAVVEAVSNLPVPPEEVCADFVRQTSGSESPQELVNIAYCRREIIDELMLVAEDAGVSLAVVDRDIQAIHDATCWLMTESGKTSCMGYPFAIVLGESPVRLIVAKDQLNIAHYALAVDANDMDEQIVACIRRSGLSEIDVLQCLVMIQDVASDAILLSAIEDRGVEIFRVDPVTWFRLAENVPAHVLVTALGMALRQGV